MGKGEPPAQKSSLRSEKRPHARGAERNAYTCACAYKTRDKSPMLRIVPLSLPRENTEEFRIEIAVRIRMMRRKRKGRDSPPLKHPFNHQSQSNHNSNREPG